MQKQKQWGGTPGLGALLGEGNGNRPVRTLCGALTSQDTSLKNKLKVQLARFHFCFRVIFTKCLPVEAENPADLSFNTLPLFLVSGLNTCADRLEMRRGKWR